MAEKMSLVTCLSGHDDDLEAYYDSIRAMGGPSGIGWDPLIEGWVVTSYSLCASLLRSPAMRRQSVALPRDRHPDLMACAEKILNSQLMFSDAASARRAYWGARLSRAMGDDRDERLRLLAARCLDEIAPSGAELYDAVLRPFASRVAAMSVGLGEEDRQRLYPLIVQCVLFLDGKIRSARALDAAMFSIVALYDQLGALFRQQAAEADRTLGDWNADLLLALVAGHESVAYLLGTLFVNLRTPPGDQAHASAVYESLRFDSPVQLIGRRVEEPIDVAGVAVPSGAKLFLHIGAANRDPSVFPCAEQFRLDRSGAAPLAFGLGEGQCLGRSIAVRSAVAFLDVLARRGEWIEIDGAVERLSGLSGRGFRRLPGRLARSAPRDREARRTE